MESVYIERDIQMFHPGSVLKVKVEIRPGELGFGRATVIDRVGNQILVQIKTSKESNKAFEKGTKLWFVSETATATFNGMWASYVVEQRLVGGRKAMLCAAPKLEPIVQRRGQMRAKLDVGVKIRFAGTDEPVEFRSIDICQSGMSVETSANLPQNLESGDMVGLLVEAPPGEFFSSARVVRVERNWLVNKVEIGVEFMDMPKDVEEILDKTLVKLGQTQDVDLTKDKGQATGLSGWAKTFSGKHKGRDQDGSESQEEETQSQEASE